MRQRECDYCKESYAIGNSADAKAISARFCSKECRYASANERKKLYRQANAIAEYIHSLSKTADSVQDTANQAIADRLIEAVGIMARQRNLSDYGGMVSAIKANKPPHTYFKAKKTGFECVECGHFVVTGKHPSKCIKCGQSELIAINPMI